MNADPQSAQDEFIVKVDKSSNLESVTAQIKAIKTYPFYLAIYDRYIQISNKNEQWSLLNGIELGWFIKEEVSD